MADIVHSPEGSWARGAGLLSAAVVVISAANYGFSLTMVRLLQPSQFSAFAAGQAVLLVISNASLAAVPWAVAQYISVEKGPHARSEAMRFGLRASALQAVIAAIIADLVLNSVSGAAAASVAAAAAALMSLSAGPVGYLQGTERVSTLAWLHLTEGIVRVVIGLVSVLLVARSAAMGLVGFAVGAGVLLALIIRADRDAWPLRKPDAAASRALIGQSLRLGAVQMLMCMLGALDTVAASAADLPSRTAGSYQAASLIGRIPLFVSTAIAIAVYTELTRAPSDAAVADHMRRLIDFYSALTLPVVLACWTIPHQILSLLIPDDYTSAANLLKYTSISGAAIGLINCLTTAHQARGRFRSSISILAPFAVAQPVVLIFVGRSYGITAFAIALVSLSVTALVVITWDARRWLLGLHLRVAPLHLIIIILALLTIFIHSAFLWPFLIIGVTACLVVSVRRHQGTLVPPSGEDDRLDAGT